MENITYYQFYTILYDFRIELVKVHLNENDLFNSSSISTSCVNFRDNGTTVATSFDGGFRNADTSRN